MIKVRCISNWSDSYPLHIRIIEQFAPDYERQNQLRFVDDDSYDYLVIFNDKKGFQPQVPKERILGFIQEPHDHSKYYDKHIGSYCAKVYTCSDRSYYPNNNNYVSASSAMFYTMHGKVQDYLSYSDFNKPYKLSLVMSNIKGGFYDTRHDVLQRILNSDLDCHIYGRDLNLKDSRYKGAPDNKAEALLPYEYSIAIENGRFEGYISEKLFDCFLCNTVPIYLGCTDVMKYYNAGAMYSLPVLNDDFIPMLKHTMEIRHRTRNALVQKAKQDYHKKYNLFNLIKNFVNGHQ